MRKGMNKRDYQMFHGRIVDAVAEREDGNNPPAAHGFRVHPPIYINRTNETYNSLMWTGASAIWYGPANPKQGQDPWPGLMYVEYNTADERMFHREAILFHDSASWSMDAALISAVEDYALALSTKFAILYRESGPYRNPRWPRPPDLVDQRVVDLLDALDDPRPNPVPVAAHGTNDQMPPEFAALRDAVRDARRALTDALGVEPSADIIVDAAREIIRARSSKMPS